jgi:hypothetical protein
MSEIKRDTGRFDRRQWYIEGHNDCFFTTEEDARDALKLANFVSLAAQDELAERVREVLP